jgi:hypothetical protein
MAVRAWPRRPFRAIDGDRLEYAGCPMGRQTRAADRLCRALAWAIGEGNHVPGVISTEDLVGLERALRSGGPLAAEHYPKLRIFSQLLWRIEVPDPSLKCSLGDALEAIAERASQLPAWPFEPAVEALSFHSLEYADAAAGIDRMYQSSQEGWSAHGEQSKLFIRAALEGLARREVVWVFGAGRAYDLPLPELAEHFSKVVLVDIDGRALDATLASIDSSLRARFELVTADLTGIAATWRARTLEVVQDAPSARDAAQRLYDLFCGYFVADESPWRFLGDRPDLIVSQMLLSQLNDPLERYPRQIYEKRFSLPLLGQHSGLSVANMLFAHRLQHDHVRFLRRHASAAVLTSDVAEQYTHLTATGAQQLVGDELLLLGAYRFAERIPHDLAIVRHKDWYWQRAVSRAPGQVGSRMRIGALLLQSSRGESP